MIVKKVLNPRRSASKAVRIAALTNYIRAPETANANEKCVYAGARGFITDTPQSQTAEMIALAQDAVRSRDPILHYVLSWREGEQPSHEQVEEAVSIFMDELGLNGHQVIYGLHADTDNLHLHLAINRVHPQTLKVVKPNRGFDIEAAHRAVARIEHVQGWQREQNGRYVVLENGELGREHYDQESSKQPSQRARDFERRTGEKSAERIAQEQAAEVIKRAQSWTELHAGLAKIGMRYEKKGSGAILWVGQQPVKASSVARDASLSASLPALQKRLGEYQPAPQQQQARREPEPIKPGMPLWDTYAKARREYYERKRSLKIEIDRRQDDERKELAERQRKERQDLLSGRWRGLGAMLNAMRSVLAAKQAAEKAALREKHRRERSHWREKYPPYPDFEQWLREQQHPELANEWRQQWRDTPQRIEGDRSEPPTARDIRDYVPQIVGQYVYYSRRDESGTAFVDKGKSIDIHDWRNRDTTLAALQLAAQKYGSFTVYGCDEYKRMCAKLAAEYGFKITNPELRPLIEQERQQIQQERAQAMKSEQLKQFERYAEAVGAQRYRVTSIKMHDDGSKQTFILDKRDGVTRGFTPQEIEQRIPEMLRLQRRGENLYYTPLSDDKHHILIDDMNREKLERLIKDGYQPAVVLESSPGNYQAIITVPKLGTPHDRDVGNRLSDRLNREYGDPKLSGAIHPHRAPGFENRKPKHQREDGSYPEVRLLKAERRECAKTLALSREIDAEYQRQAEQRQQQQESKEISRAPAELAAASSSAIDAYQRHYRDVMRMLNSGGVIDYSRVDSMIAVRMRVTGHDQAAIEGAIRECAPKIRPQDQQKRNWDDYNDYARRTARYAFSPAGDSQVEKLSKYKLQWQRLEGRTQAQAKQKEQRGQQEQQQGMQLSI